MPPAIEPARAAVRPRVHLPGSTVPRWLDEEVAELLTAERASTLLLVGDRGIGKTTALAHLAAVFAGEERLRLVDDAGPLPLPSPVPGLVTVQATQLQPLEPGQHRQLHLRPWTDDEVLDYLRVAHGDRIAEVFRRWQTPLQHDLGRWPGLCLRVLARLADDALLADPLQALGAVLRARLGEDFAELANRALRGFVVDPRAIGDPSPLPVLMQGWSVCDSSAARGLLAAHRLLEFVLRQPRGTKLQVKWLLPLRTALQHTLRHAPDRLAQLAAVTASARLRHKAAAHGIHCLAATGHRPAHALRGDCRHAWLRAADLRGMRIRADLTHSDLGAADLRGTRFDRCNLERTNLRDAIATDSTWTAVKARTLCAVNLRGPGSRWSKCLLTEADFLSAHLEGATFEATLFARCSLRSASLFRAELAGSVFQATDLEGADLRDADCTEARFSLVDLRGTHLRGATCRHTWFRRCDLAGTELPELLAEHARFDGSDLTGARWPGARLAGASFAEAGLAEVDWEGADLRGCSFHRATFHLGSSRSGLVDSPIASEGSRTGFYTDESFEHGFRAPEDVRKANLRNCDLRGARIEGTDFYLVDLRGARIDLRQRVWLRRCRAILDSEERHSA